MKKLTIFYLTLVSMASIGCGALKESVDHEFGDGYYRSSSFGVRREPIYLVAREDYLLVYPVSGSGGEKRVDTSMHTFVDLPPVFEGQQKKSYHFVNHSFDFDLMTIALKYRPEQGEIPHQLNAGFNGAIYLGYRTDIFSLFYEPTPLGESQRNFKHFGFDYGAFLGLGTTLMNATVTGDQIAIDYDGIIFSKGIGAFAGLDSFGFGLTLGWDNLLDKNRKFWLFQGKPWLGIAFGVNLN